MNKGDGEGPMSDRYLLISADTHAGANHEQYREYLDPACRDEFDEWRDRYKNPFRDLHGKKRDQNWNCLLYTSPSPRDRS